MSDNEKLKNALDTILNQIGREPLANLWFEPIEPERLDDFLARLNYYVSPSYLPVADYEGNILALHLWPGFDYLSSPVVFIQHDLQEVKYICNGLRALPAGLLLFVGRYFKNEKEEFDLFKKNINRMLHSIDSALTIPESLWQILLNSEKRKPTWWAATCDEVTNLAWKNSILEHPFAGIPKVDVTSNLADAFSLLKPFLLNKKDVPELLALLISLESLSGEIIDKKDLITVLSAEFWRERDFMLGGLWRKSGDGIAELDAMMKSISDRKVIFEGTPYEPLIDHPETYSGKDKEGPLTLMQIAQHFREKGDYVNELKQLRNAATLQVLAWGSCRPELANMIAVACDKVHPDSLAAAVARESARVYEQGP